MKSIKLFIGAGFGSGYFPVAPGTVGSLSALLPVYFALKFHEIAGPLIIALLASIATLWVSKVCVEAWGKDPGRLVMDEFAGQSLVFVTIPLSFDLTSDIIILSIGFILFRFFDILKPLGIKKLQNIEGGPGILLDDIIAGFYAFICLKTLIFVLPEIFDFV